MLRHSRATATGGRRSAWRRRAARAAPLAASLDAPSCAPLAASCPPPSCASSPRASTLRAAPPHREPRRPRAAPRFVRTTTRPRSRRAPRPELRSLAASLDAPSCASWPRASTRHAPNRAPSPRATTRLRSRRVSTPRAAPPPHKRRRGKRQHGPARSERHAPELRPSARPTTGRQCGVVPASAPRGQGRRGLS